MYKCPGCGKRCSTEGGLLCDPCYEAAVAENAKAPSQVVTMPDAIWKDVFAVLRDQPVTRRRFRKSNNSFPI